MKRIFFIFFASFIFTYTFGHQSTEITILSYSECKSDTIYTNYSSNLITRGITSLNDSSRVDYNNVNPDLINEMTNEYIKNYTPAIIKSVLKGYGCRECETMLKALIKSNRRSVFFILIRVSNNGDITSVKFMYHKSLSDFMTNEDVTRNSQIVINSKPTPFLAEYGIKLSPWIIFPVGKEHIHKFLKEEATEE